MATFSQFVGVLSSNPFLAIVMALVIGSIFVNGSTDAANAIAEPVGTRSISVRNAIIMSVICNFVGLVGMSMFSTAVADTMSGMVDFGGDTRAALIALAAATVGIVAWGVGAWVFGIPTSESHALIAGLTGAAIAVHG
ncbi:MAG: inorganic phosphate transporter, partial [Atopobiaceae bacterium]|nr:inorganic phosphate transporter [Atopobiaceae bacterium]